jgi:transaldolase
MADAGQDPMPEIKNSVKFARRYKNVEILWASTREPYNYLQSKQINCHIITIPPSIIEKIEKFGKSFNKLTIDTVKTFLIDSKKSKFTI